MVKRKTRKDRLLEMIADLGCKATRKEINNELPRYWELEKDDMEIEEHTGKPRYWHRSAGVCQALKDRNGYLDNPTRGVWEITDKGWEYLESKGYKCSTVTINQQQLIETSSKILNVLKNFEKSGITSFTTEEIRIALVGQGVSYETNEIEESIRFLSEVPFQILKKEEDKYALPSDMDTILKK